MPVETPEAIHLKDYRKPEYIIPETRLLFQLYEDRTFVRSTLKISRARQSDGPNPPLILNGEKLNLKQIALNGNALQENQYLLSDRFLTVPNPPDSFTLETVCEIKPHENTALEGLYRSGGTFCTQNESEGFRKITYFLDRPDVLSKFWTRIEADKKGYPILLSNGNPRAAGDLPDHRHFAEWEDPFLKPCYLFALVAGDLASVQDQFRTRSGRNVQLRIYVDKGNESKCAYAMDSLKKAMKWDEETFGLECDLDHYMIVAVNDFNFGAMENKGLNIFNSQYILADPKTATDSNFEAILGVIGHEYFHNWTGNRVTCRDWFQITLKEGLTIFRDQEFTADMTSRAVKRIDDVRALRDHQFPEDAGPNAHPIRPESYMEINNFYTVTVYEKGAEVIRMIETLIGKRAFKKGITKYFELYDGQAVTTDDFVHAMEAASGLDLGQFKLWYSRAGTPHCEVEVTWDEKKHEATVKVRQTSSNDGNPDSQKPLYFPLNIGLLSSNGSEFLGTSKTLMISKPEESFTFSGITSKPVPSLLRNFSAPVHLDYEYSLKDLAFLFANDTDSFNRYEAGQRLALHAIKRLIDDSYQRLSVITVEKNVVAAFGQLIHQTSIDPAFKAECLILPSLTTITEDMDICDFEAAYAAREFLLKTLSEEFEDVLIDQYDELQTDQGYFLDQKSVGRRSLKHVLLAYLLSLNEKEHIDRAKRQFDTATNMTDEVSALSLLCHRKGKTKEEALAAFHDKWKQDPIVMNKWFAVQAGSHTSDVLNQIQALEKHPSFDIKNPNKVRSLFGVFGHNLLRFHDGSGKGYAFLAEKILEIDSINPSVAAHLAGAYKKFAKLDVARKILMERELRRIISKRDLSKHTYEIVSKTLGK